VEKRIINATPKITNMQLSLERFKGNPILKSDMKHQWETKAVFNPAAIYDGGRVHILYRAIGESDVSVLGYASSSDGVHFDERLDKPVYMPREPFEGVNTSHSCVFKPTSLYVSGGGGMGGCEDPRLTRIGERVYMTYVAYDGHSHPRVALSSIQIDAFLDKQWNWQKPVLISPPHIVDKNACILPEKIDGKYVIFHRVFPNILIDFVDNLDFDGKTRWLQGQFKIPTRALSSDWDNLKVGCGPPPIKTKEGWLLIYHAVSSFDESRYKIGAMLLDLKDPTKVLARTRVPILEPTTAYENEGWKSGVVYPCGAVIIDDRLFVYYGGADTVVCVASVKLEPFLEQLVMNHKESKLPSVPTHPPAKTGEILGTVQGFCIKCRRTGEINNPHHVILKNLRHTIQGICPRCGGKMSRFIKSNQNGDDDVLLSSQTKTKTNKKSKIQE
jgi:beta-1,2-mannobiose phosphorylase / 1,2-beta-oligomannan phosphorylase